MAQVSEEGTHPVAQPKVIHIVYNCISGCVVRGKSMKYLPSSVGFLGSDVLIVIFFLFVLTFYPYMYTVLTLQISKACALEWLWIVV